jgi:hypothetical protein
MKKSVYDKMGLEKNELTGEIETFMWLAQLICDSE